MTSIPVRHSPGACHSDIALADFRPAARASRFSHAYTGRASAMVLTKEVLPPSGISRNFIPVKKAGANTLPVKAGEVFNFPGT